MVRNKQTKETNEFEKLNGNHREMLLHTRMNKIKKTNNSSVTEE